MSAAELHDEPEQIGPPTMDVIISVLGALVAGVVVWSICVGVIAGINYAGEYFQIGPPTNALLAGAIQTAYLVFPILAALGAAGLAYRFLIRLP